MSLAYTLCVFIFILVPALYYGAPMLTTTLLVLVVTTLISFVFIDGISKKTVAAFLGTTLGVLFACGIAYVMSKWTHITGFQTTEAESLLLECYDHGLKVTNILLQVY